MGLHLETDLYLTPAAATPVDTMAVDPPRTGFVIGLDRGLTLEGLGHRTELHHNPACVDAVALFLGEFGTGKGIAPTRGCPGTMPRQSWDRGKR